MPNAASQVERCPVATQDQRRSAAAVGAGSLANAVPVTGYAAVRDALRASGSREAGFKAELVTRRGRLPRPPILFLTGEAHRRQRAATARFFAPRVIDE